MRHTNSVPFEENKQTRENRNLARLLGYGETTTQNPYYIPHNQTQLWRHWKYTREKHTIFGADNFAPVVYLIYSHDVSEQKKYGPVSSAAALQAQVWVTLSGSDSRLSGSAPVAGTFVPLR